MGGGSGTEARQGLLTSRSQMAVLLGHAGESYAVEPGFFLMRVVLVMQEGDMAVGVTDQAQPAGAKGIPIVLLVVGGQE